LEPSDHEGSLGLGEEFCAIREVLDDPNRRNAGYYRGKTFNNTKICDEHTPSQRRGITDKIHDQAGFPPFPSRFEIAAYLSLVKSRAKDG
jgi:hypothetical protein